MSRFDPAGVWGWRFVGPYRGGRVMAVLGDPRDPRTAYCGSSSGGVWKTGDAGANWRNLSDPYFRRGSIGALAMAPSDSDTLYAGTGECGFRANVTGGDGVYGSDDGGRTWRHLGLVETHNIGRIRVHPRDPRVVYVAALGHRFGPNPARGVFRSADGGRTWEHVLALGERAGAVDLAIDPRDPRVLYAAVWEAIRRPWGVQSGGGASGLYKTTDGGATWRSLSDRPGWPRGRVGRTAVCVSPVDPFRLYALVEADGGEGGVYRSSDAGESWTWTNDDSNFLVRAWYLTHIVADPHERDAVWLPNRKLWRSRDGGRTFALLNVSYWDQHDVWVDPADPRHLVLGNDGGASISYDSGGSWSTVFNQPTAELYHAAADTRFPYRIYTAQQDNSTLSLPVRSDIGPLSEMDWFDVGGGESGHIVVRPDNPDVVFASDLGGRITRYDHANGQIHDISPWPEEMAGYHGAALPYRYNWSTPLLLSPHDPGTLYCGANVVFRTRDEGASWEEISPDLTHADEERLSPGGGLAGFHEGQANEGDTVYGSIASLAAAPRAPGVLWAGSDDGRLHVTRDDGGGWRDVTPPGAPPWSILSVEASPHDGATAYVAASAHMHDDVRPYVFRTRDYGASWEEIGAGIPPDQFVRAVREDPARPGLLYAATEAGVHYSLDDGATWRSLQGNLPACAVYDLLVKDGDLIAATHGRGLWVMDDLTPLHQWDDAGSGAGAGLVENRAAGAGLVENRAAGTGSAGVPPAQVVPAGQRERAAGILAGSAVSVRLFRPRPAYRLIRRLTGQDTYIAMGYPCAAPNPPDGAVVTYYLDAPPDGALSLSLRDGAGREIAAYTSAPEAPAPRPLGPPVYATMGGAATLAPRAADEPAAGVRVGALNLPSPRPAPASAGVPVAPGLNRVAVALAYPPAPAVLDHYHMGSTAVPLAPGGYEIRLAVGGEIVATAPLDVRADPRAHATPEDYAAQTALLLEIRDVFGRLQAMVARLRRARAGLAALAARADGLPGGDAVRARAQEAQGRLDRLERAVVQVGLGPGSGELSGGSVPIGLGGQLERLASGIAGSDDAPTAQARAVYGRLRPRAEETLAAFDALVAADLAELNRQAVAAGVPAVAPEG